MRRRSSLAAEECLSEEVRCSICIKSVPRSNILVHEAHCSRDLKRCFDCGEMVPGRLADQHYSKTHGWVPCPQCHKLVGSTDSVIHELTNCGQKPLFKKKSRRFLLSAKKPVEPQVDCGDKMDISIHREERNDLHERDRHESQCDGNADFAAGSSREIRDDGSDLHPTGEPREKSPRGGIVLTAAIIGIAIILGFPLLWKKAEKNETTRE